LEALVPILVRPVREQLEHDRIIRLLEAKWRRKFKVDANPGDERNVGVKVPVGTLFPDLILTDEGGRKPKALVEVETNESVNHLEAMAQWAHLAKSKTALSLIVPVGAVEAARRLAGENGIKLAEVWTYHVLGDQVRFTSVFREHGADPADLIEKVDVFTTERAAPAPRPVPVEPAEVVEPPAPAEVERPRKLAIKAGSRPAVEGIAARIAPKMAVKVGAKTTAPEAPAPAAKAAASPKATAAKVEPPPARPAVAAKSVVPAKPAMQVKPAAPVKAAAPAPAPAPVKAVAPVKPPIAVKPAAAPTKAVSSKPVEKAVAKKAAAKPEVKKVVAAKAVTAKAPAKPAVAAKKAAPAKPASRPAARKAAPVRPAPRVVAAKKAAPVAKARPSKRR
jgi:hypothetical protein